MYFRFESAPRKVLAYGRIEPRFAPKRLQKQRYCTAPIVVGSLTLSFRPVRIFLVFWTLLSYLA
jgi:hypothetical protein